MRSIKTIHACTPSDYYTSVCVKCLPCICKQDTVRIFLKFVDDKSHTVTSDITKLLFSLDSINRASTIFRTSIDFHE